MKIALAGLGYVGLANAILLAQHNEVVVGGDLDSRKVATVSERRCPSGDPEMEDCFDHKSPNLRATLEKQEAYSGADVVITSTITDYDAAANYFNTCSIESVIQDVLIIAPKGGMVIKSPSPRPGRSWPFYAQTPTNRRHLLQGARRLEANPAMNQRQQADTGRKSGQNQLLPPSPASQKHAENAQFSEQPVQTGLRLPAHVPRHGRKSELTGGSCSAT